MASVAPDGGATISVAVHAGNHRRGLLFSDDVTFSHRTVTSFTGDPGVFEMNLVRKVHVVWHPIYGHPGYRLLLLIILRQLLYEGAVRFDRTVAVHAFLLGRVGHERTRLRHPMTKQAVPNKL